MKVSGKYYIQLGDMRHGTVDDLDATDIDGILVGDALLTMEPLPASPLLDVISDLDGTANAKDMG